MDHFKSETRAAGRSGAGLGIAVVRGHAGARCRCDGGGADQDTSARMLVPVGHTVGIKLFARGVMVVKAPESGTPADDCGLQTGDIIVKCGGVSVTSSEQFQSLLQENGETATDLQVRREGGSVTLSVSPEQNEKGAYCIGAWIPGQHGRHRHHDVLRPGKRRLRRSGSRDHGRRHGAPDALCLRIHSALHRESGEEGHHRRGR